ncbi:9798_t:CDS:2 [Funneliformis mosseae]|uniref:9798_t:CDS:1 n=1 Tax=Funneliformis mosseae TaxID=27381 RepID=A0A9N9B2Y2_FUNMO|nr:9798_t:CDS:2 [Funneliformis mosseae]
MSEKSSNKSHLPIGQNASPIVGPDVRSLEEALSIILQNIPIEIKTPNETTKISEKMPLKERDTNKALKIFNVNVTKSFDLFNSKSSFNFLVCSGAAGIGKTRWRNEFFNSVKKDWSPPPSWEKPEYLYLLLDFVTGSCLCDLDINLTASIILGLRIAYHYFVRRDGRIMSFETFQVRACHFFKHFRINVVLESIQNHLLSGLNKKLIIVLHIDEFQEIFAFENSWKGGLSGKGLFKEMLCALRPLMMESETTYFMSKRFYQGQDHKMLSITLKQQIIPSSLSSLLYNTSGLSQALETVLDECFKRDGCQLLYYCIGAIPVQLNAKLDSEQTSNSRGPEARWDFNSKESWT